VAEVVCAACLHEGYAGQFFAPDRVPAARCPWCGSTNLTANIRRVEDVPVGRLLDLVKGLRRMLYGALDEDGNDVLDPDNSVDAAELAAWAVEELRQLGLTPVGVVPDDK